MILQKIGASLTVQDAPMELNEENIIIFYSPLALLSPFSFWLAVIHVSTVK